MKRVLEGVLLFSAAMKRVLEGVPTFPAAMKRVLEGVLLFSAAMKRVLEGVPTFPAAMKIVLEGVPTFPAVMKRVLEGVLPFLGTALTVVLPAARKLFTARVLMVLSNVWCLLSKVYFTNFFLIPFATACFILLAFSLRAMLR